MDTVHETQNRLKDWILRKLAVREHTRAELLRKALDLGFSRPDTEMVLDWAAERGYQSDQRFIDAWVREWKRQGRGPHWMKAKFQQKGIVLPHNWSQEESKSPNDEDGPDEVLLTAKKWVDRRYPKYRDSYPEKRKALAALLRRGFSFEVAERILKDTSENTPDA